MPTSSPTDPHAGTAGGKGPAWNILDTLTDFIVATRSRPAAYRIALSIAFILLALLIRVSLFSSVGGRAAFVPFNAAVVLSAVLDGGAGCATALLLSILIIHFAFAPFTDGTDLAVLVSFLTTAALLSILVERLASTRTRLVAAEHTCALDANLRVFIEQAPVAIAMFDREMRTLAASRQWIESYNLPANINGQSHYDLFPNLPESFKEVHRRALAGETIRSSGDEYLLPDGTPRCERWEVMPWRLDDGSVGGITLFTEDITDRRAVEISLAASEERLRLAIEAAGMAVWDWDMRTGKDTWNAQSYRMIGYEPGEIEPGFATWQRHMHPDDRDRVTQQYETSIETGADVFNENRMIDRFGNVKWVSARGRAVLDPSGTPIRSFGVITDITDRKQAEDRDRLLSAEVNHRAKNLLAVVQAVAIKTARYCAPEDFVPVFNERLKSLAASHDLLINSKWQGVEITNLIRAQLCHFDDISGSRIRIEGSKAELTADAAQAIGLALHELVTNASKYGALSSPNGSITISWKVVDSTEGPRFRMRWQEAGGPTVTPPSRQGFGHGMLFNMARYSLGAEVDLSYPASGLVWDLNAPVDLVLQQAPRPT
jgi:PAS domain S-box-containing protein